MRRARERTSVLRKLFLVVFLLLILPGIVSAWTGKVVAVSDGDTIKVMHMGVAEKRGLWSHPKPMPPWQFRRIKRGK
jgi:endonuclease YncB( thermonuclease family)